MTINIKSQVQVFSVNGFFFLRLSQILHIMTDNKKTGTIVSITIILGDSLQPNLHVCSVLSVGWWSDPVNCFLIHYIKRGKIYAM